MQTIESASARCGGVTWRGLYLHRLKALSFAVAGLSLLILGGTQGARALPFDPLSVGLNPGDEYRLAFVTEGSRDATSSLISDYNEFVTTEANLPGSSVANLGLTWTAIASTEIVDARTNTSTNPLITGVPIYRLDGAIIASDYSDLWDGSISSPLIFSQFLGTPPPDVWTGTQTDGTVFSNLFLGTGSSILGSTLLSDSGWVFSQLRVATLLEFQFYAMSSALTVQDPTVSTTVPEPGSLALLGAGLAVLGVLRRRRRKA